MFGIVPRQLWERMTMPDEKNMCTWAMRCLLIETDNRKILVDTGIGDKQDEKFRKHFEPHGEDSLLQSLAAKDLKPEDVTDVFLTHLHFDHVGGAVRFDDNQQLVPTFPNATYWSNEAHYNWALHPNAKEKASFLKENFVPLQEAGVLQFIDIQDGWFDWQEGIQLFCAYGHTEAMMLLKLQSEGQTYVYGADLIPSTFHLGRPYVMSFDVRPLSTLEEKAVVLDEILEQGHTLIFEHDPKIAAATLTRNDRGKVVVNEEVNL